MSDHNARKLSTTERPDIAASERRHENRVPAPLKLLIKCAVEDEAVEMGCRDVSSGGTFIVSPTPLRRGTLIKIRASGSTGIDGVGRVVWVRDPDRSSRGKPPGMGVKFIRLSDRSVAAIEQLMARCAPSPSEQAPWLDADRDSAQQDELHAAADSGVRVVAPALRKPERESGAARPASASIDHSEHAVNASSGTAEQPQARDVVDETLMDDAPTARYVSPRTIPPVAAALRAKAPRRAPPPLPPHAARPHEMRTVSIQTEPSAVTTSTDQGARKASEGGRRRARPVIANAALGAAAVLALSALLWATSEEEPTQRSLPEPIATVPTAPEPAAQNAPATVPAAPAPQPTVAVAVATRPEGAEIIVEDTVRGNAPLTLQLQAGTKVVLRARAPGHAEARMELTPGESQEPLLLELPALPHVLRVESDPPGAWLVVTGAPRVRAPADIELRDYDGKRVGLTAGLYGYANQFMYVSPDQFVEQDGAIRADIKLTLKRPRLKAIAQTDQGTEQTPSGEVQAAAAKAADETAPAP